MWVAVGTGKHVNEGWLRTCAHALWALKYAHQHRPHSCTHMKGEQFSENKMPVLQPHSIIAFAQSCSSMCIWLWKDSHGILLINRRITDQQNEPAEAWECTCVNNSDNRNLNESLLKFSLISAMFISNYCCYSCFLWDCIWSKSALWLQTSTVAFFSI